MPAEMGQRLQSLSNEQNCSEDEITLLYYIEGKYERRLKMVKDITDANFEEETNEGVSLVDFWATWCGPCRMQSPIIDELDEEMGDKVNFSKMDVDANPNTPQKFGIMGIPTLLVKKDGEVVEKLVGYTPKEKLEEILAQYV